MQAKRRELNHGRKLKGRACVHLEDESLLASQTINLAPACALITLFDIITCSLTLCFQEY